jgi:hypothetical protein
LKGDALLAEQDAEPLVADVVDHPLGDQEIGQLAQAPGGERQAVVAGMGPGDLLDFAALRQGELSAIAASEENPTEANLICYGASALPTTPGGLGVVEVALVAITAGFGTPQQSRGARRARLSDRELRAAPAPGALAYLRLPLSPAGGEEPKPPRSAGVAPVNR